MIDVAALQAIANTFIETTDVVIRHRMGIDKDPTNRTGDDTSEFEPATTSVKGWFVDIGTRTFATGGGMGEVVDRPTLRVPVGTRIASRDEATINGQTWVVIDASGDESYPVMVKAALSRVE